MTVRPINFFAHEVRATLEGRKTQTRRIIKPQPVHVAADTHRSVLVGADNHRYRVGDTLWVREAFIGARGYDPYPPSKFGNKPIWYVADGEPDRDRWWHLSDRKRPATHMPRWASRITLRVTAVRVERLHDITEEDARAEGSRREYLGPPDATNPERFTLSARASFSGLWDQIHGPGAWDANPWVVALTFERVTPDA